MDGVPTQTAGTSELLASDWNTYVRDNFDSIKFGHVVCTSSTRPTGIAEGTMIYETDTNKVLVYNGSSWKEISDLDSANGLSASGQDKLDDVGLDIIATQTFTSVSSVSVNDVFTSTYRNYKVNIVDIEGSTNVAYSFRMRASGSDASGSNTYVQRGLTSINSALTNLASSLNLGNVGDAVNNEKIAWASMEFKNPQVAQATNVITQSYSRTSLDDGFYIIGCRHTPTTSYDGFSLFTNTGTFSGRLSVYGYREV